MKKNSVLVVLLIVLMCVSLVFTGCQKAGNDGENGKNDTTTTTGENGGSGEGENKPGDIKPEFEDPNEQVAYAIGNTMSSMVSADAITAVLGEAIKGGKITIEAADTIKNVLYMDVEGNQYADILTVNMGEEVEFGAYLKDGKLAVSAPTLFGEDVYGVDFNTLLTDLETTELWALLGTSYEEFKSQAGIDLDAIGEALEKYMGVISDMGSSLEGCLDGVEVTREKGTVTINGETVNAVNVKYHLTSDDAHAFMNAYLDEMEKSMEAMKEAMADVLTDVDLDEVMGEMDVDTIRQDMDDVFENMDLEGDLVISIHPETQNVMNVSFDIAGTADGEEGKIEMDLVLGVDPANNDKFSFVITVEADGERNSMNADLVFASEGTVDTTTLTVTEYFNDEGDVIATAELTYDNSNGKYELVLADEWETTSVNGVYLVTADKFEFSVEKIVNTYDDGESIETELGLRLCVETINKAEIPTVSNMKNILKLSQDELAELISLLTPEEPDYSDEYYDEDIYFDEDYYGDSAA